MASSSAAVRRAAERRAEAVDMLRAAAHRDLRAHLLTCPGCEIVAVDAPPARCALGQTHEAAVALADGLA